MAISIINICLLPAVLLKSAFTFQFMFKIQSKKSNMREQRIYSRACNICFDATIQSRKKSLSVSG